MHQHFWQYLSVRIIVGWLLVCLLPAVALFWKYILTDNILITQVNSVVASSVALILSLIGLERLTQFPGQKSMVTVLPTLLASGLIVGLLLLVFRVPYSVYYLSLSGALGLLFFLFRRISASRHPSDYRLRSCRSLPKSIGY